MNFSVAFRANGKDCYIDGMTESQATKTLRSLVAEFYNREMGCTNSLARHFGDIYVQRNGKVVLEYDGENFWRIKRAEYFVVDDWEDIFQKNITKI